MGFALPEIEAIAVKVNRTYADMIHGERIQNKSAFIESLTHDGFFVQIPRISGDTNIDWEQSSELRKMLSLFEKTSRQWSTH